MIRSGWLTRIGWLTPGCPTYIVEQGDLCTDEYSVSALSPALEQLLALRYQLAREALPVSFETDKHLRLTSIKLNGKGDGRMRHRVCKSCVNYANRPKCYREGKRKGSVRKSTYCQCYEAAAGQKVEVASATD